MWLRQALKLTETRMQATATAKSFPVTHSDAEWQRILTPEQYRVMRQHGTERPGSCALLHEHRPGTFHCVGCEQPLFRSNLKFESATPSSSGR